MFSSTASSFWLFEFSVRLVAFTYERLVFMKFAFMLVGALLAFTASAITATKEYVDRRDAQTLAKAGQVATNYANSVSEKDRAYTDQKVAKAVPGNYETVSNRAMSAVQNELDPNVADWARVGQPKPATSLEPATNYTDAVSVKDRAYTDLKVSKARQSVFRGVWPSWSEVPSDPKLYLPDADGSTTPRNGDEIVVEQLSDFKELRPCPPTTWTREDSQRLDGDQYQFAGSIEKGWIAIARFNEKTVLFSRDAKSWTAGTGGVGDWGTLAYGGGVFVCSKDQDGIYRSVDGMNWTRATVGDNEEQTIWNDIAYGAGRFVALAQYAEYSVYASSDGSTWTPVENEVGNLSGLRYLNGRFVAWNASTASRLSSIYTSADGLKWNEVASSKGRWTDVSFAGGRYIAVCRKENETSEPGFVYWSEDLSSWTRYDALPQAQWRRVVSSTNGAVVVSAINSSVERYLYWSTDSERWTRITDDKISDGFGIFCDGRMMLMGVYQDGIYSCDTYSPFSPYVGRFLLAYDGEWGGKSGWKVLYKVAADGGRVDSVNGKIGNVTLSAGDVGAFSSTAGASLQTQVTTIGAHLNAEDARFVVTNYNSEIHTPEAYVEIKLPDSSWSRIWSEMTRWNWLTGTYLPGNFYTRAEIDDKLADKADRAWGFYDSTTGAYAPDGYTWISSPKIAIAANLAYQRTITSDGAIWVLESNGVVTETGGMTNGFFRVSDDEGNSLFEIVKGSKRTIGADASSAKVIELFTPKKLQIGYSIVSDVHPKIDVCTSLKTQDWKAEDDADCVANVSWSGASGAWIAEVQGKAAYPTLFVKATYEVGGETYISNSAPVSMQYLMINGVKYKVGTATISGHTVLTLTVAQ